MRNFVHYEWRYDCKNKIISIIFDKPLIIDLSGIDPGYCKFLVIFQVFILKIELLFYLMKET